MPLLSLKTNLKSLKYGHDQPGGGNSNQPYHQVNINLVDGSRFRMTRFDDGLVRGGMVGADNASIVDSLRIGKFLTDFPKGPLFITKQVGLQLSNPQLEHKKLKTDNPTKGQGLFKNIGNFVTNTANKLTNAVGPTRLYNLGINTLAQVSVNAFGQHIDRHGLLPARDNDNLYFKVVLNNNDETNNRLVGLKSILGNINDINDYIGGPGSVYGLGHTLIRRRGDFIDINRDTTSTEWATKGAFKNSTDKQSISFTTAGTNINNFLGLSAKYYRSSLAENNFTNDGEIISYTSANQPRNLFDNTSIIYQPSSFSSDKVAKASDKARNGAFSRISTKTSSSFAPYKFDNNINDNSVGFDDVIKFKNYTGAETWTPQNGERRKPIIKNDIGHGDKAISSYPEVDLEENNIIVGMNQSAVGSVKTYSELKNKINKKSSINQNYFQTISVNVSRNDPDFKYVKAELANKFNRTNDVNINDDTLALQFTPLDPFTGNNLNILRFLGYITDFSENYDSTWSDVNYAGRAESFYIFNKFKRTVSVGFNITCYNATELEEKHCALSELASTLAGKYKDNLLMGGIITRLKLGRYINNQPGIITNLTFSPIQDSSWDLDRQLAFYLKVSFGFTLIHDFLPQYYKCGFIDREPEVPPPPKKEDKPKPPPSPNPTPTPGPSPKPNPNPTPIPKLDPEIRRDGAIYDEQYRLNQYTRDIDKRFRNYNSGKSKFGGFGGGSSGGAGASGEW